MKLLRRWLRIETALLIILVVELGLTVLILLDVSDRLPF